MMEQEYILFKAYCSERGFTTEEEVFRSYSMDDRSNYRDYYDGFDPFEEDELLLEILDRAEYLYG